MAGRASVRAFELAFCLALPSPPAPPIPTGPPAEQQASHLRPEPPPDSAQPTGGDAIQTQARFSPIRGGALRRFAEDLFAVVQTVPNQTDKAIAEDYILGAGDRVQVSAFGGGNFQHNLDVDGRGRIVIPNVGSVKVGGIDLARARASVQKLVARQFTQTSVDLSILHLRNIRIAVLGEVYRPGTYLVPSLSSLVNVLSLAGGPSEAGSFREIRLLRGGKVVHRLDLYPLRTEGLGSFNITLQSGDTVFIPLAFNQVILEGAFTRVVAAPFSPLVPGFFHHQSRPLVEGKGTPDGPPPQPPTQSRGDHRVPEDSSAALSPSSREWEGLPEWLARWRQSGHPPRLQFEMRPGETHLDALQFAGGLALNGSGSRLAIRRLGPNGTWRSLPMPSLPTIGVPLASGDVLSAYASREQAGGTIRLTGWVRVPGAYHRPPGNGVGDLLKAEDQVLPDTYLRRGEITRTNPDQTTRHLAFDVAKALAGDPAHNLILEDGDYVELYRTLDLHLGQTVEAVGPLARPGHFPFRDGMRVSDLLFQAGPPLPNANLRVGELTRATSGHGDSLRRLDLTLLLSTGQVSPILPGKSDLDPPLLPGDRVTVFRQPTLDLRTVTLEGEISRPGAYTLDKPGIGIRDLLERAGGLTADAMPRGLIFLRNLPTRAKEPSPPPVSQPMPEAVNGILERLSETRRDGRTGSILRPPLLHSMETLGTQRLVVDLPGILSGKVENDLELVGGDRLIIPRITDTAYILGETASPFMAYHVTGGLKIHQAVRLAGGFTRNADPSGIRLLKADGRILDGRIQALVVEPGDAVLIPQKIRRDRNWTEELSALTPLALLLNAIRAR